MPDNLARFRALQEKSYPQMFNSDTVSAAIDENAQSIENQRAQIEAYLAKVKEAQSQPETPNLTVDGTTEAPSYDFNTPVAGESARVGEIPVVTQAFGNRSSVEQFSKGVNLGTDFGVKKGTPLALPPGEWEVMTTFTGAKEGNRGANSGSGNLVKVINTKTGEMLAFEHLSGVGVRPGQKINGGTVIGLSGNTGNSTGPHASIPYQDAQGKYHDVLSSPYAKYIFGQVNGSTTGKGGGMTDIQTKAKEFLDRAKYAGEVVKTVGVNALQGLGKTFIYNPDTNQAFPQSPYWKVKAVNEIQDPEQKRQAMQRVATDLVMAGTVNSPSVVGKVNPERVSGILTDIERFDDLIPQNQIEALTNIKDLANQYVKKFANSKAMQRLEKEDPDAYLGALSKEISKKTGIVAEPPIRPEESILKPLNLDTPSKPLSVEPVGGKKVYHATNKQFDNFDISKAKTDMGGAKAIFFSETPEGTKYYQRGENSRVIETNISPEAKIFDYQNPEHTALLENFIQESSKNKPEWGDSLRRLIKSGDWGTIEGKDIQGVIKKLGFDGFYDMDMTGHRAIGITNPKVISPSPLGGKVRNK